MRNSKLLLGRLILMFPLFMIGTILVSTAQSEGANQSIFRYAVNNQIIINNQKQNLFSVLKDLNKTRGIFFLFSDSSIANKQVAVPDMNGFIEDILSVLLKDTGLKYKKISKNTFVIISDKTPSEKTIDGNLYNLIETPYGELRFASVSTSYYEPPRKIIGKIVSSKDGRPLEGVSVKVKGQKIGTSTKSDGSFTLEVPENATLEFSAIGYLTTSSKPTASGKISITLQEAASDLEDVVVVAYGTQKRSTFTGAATTVNNQMIEDVPRTSFQESLQGNAVGVLSTNGSGQPGGVPSIRIRGIGSITASSAPLYVIDGIPVVSGDISNGFNSNTIAAVNPLDIQSMIVLKDAAATALYGSRGANGVILITTKKGKAGTTTLNTRLQTGINYVTVGNSKYKTANTSQMLEYLHDAYKNTLLVPNPNNFIANPSDTTQSGFNAIVAQYGINPNINTDWFKQVLHPGKYNNVALNVSGGDEKTTFYLSASYYQQDGTQKGTDYKKITTLLNLSHKVSNRFTLTGGFSGTYQLANSSDVGSNFDNPTRAMYRLQNWLTVYNPDGSFRTDYNSGYNPIAIQTADIRRTTTFVFRGTANGVYKIIPGLTYESNIGIDYSHAINNQYNDPRYGNANTSKSGSINYFSGDISNWVWTNIVRYKKQFSLIHDFEIFAGYEASKRNDGTQSSGNYSLSQIGLTSESNGSIATLAQGIPFDVPSSSLVSQFLQGTYTFNNRVFLSSSIRNDNSSKVKSSQFWSVGAGWDISKEKFFSVPGIYSLKLRSSYGKTGNSIGLSNFASLSLYDVTTPYSNQPGMSYYQMGGNIKWEKNYPFNIGFDVAFLRNRLSLSFDWYTRKTTDLIMPFPVSGLNGITSISGNYGQMKNQGFEIILNTVNIQPKHIGGLRWTSQVNFSTNKNTILKLVNNYVSNDYDRHVGSDFYQWYLRSYSGVRSDNGQAQWKDSAKGRVRDTTNYTSGSYYDQGSALPKFYGSLINIISYKHFTLMFQLYCNWGNKIYDQNGYLMSSDGSYGFLTTGNVSYYDYSHRWRKPGDITDVPAPVYLGTQTGSTQSQPSTRFLYDGSYIRLRDVMISYDFPAKWMSKAKLSKTRVYIRANNLFTYKKDKRLFYDPETPVDGTINLRPPTAATILFGADINF